MVNSVIDFFKERQHALTPIKDNLQKAQERMKNLKENLL